MRNLSCGSCIRVSRRVREGLVLPDEPVQTENLAVCNGKV